MHENDPNIVDLFISHTERDPNKLYVGYLTRGERLDESLTYTETFFKARRIACLIEERFSSEARVVLAFSPGTDFIVSLFGCFMSGRAAAPIAMPSLRKFDPAYFSRILKVADTRAVLTDSDDLVDYFAEHLPEVTVISVTAPDIDQYDSVRWAMPVIKNDTIALVQFTSGSTSDPKGVVITHQNLHNNENIIATKATMSSKDIIVGWLPHYHDMGLISNILLMAFLGGSYYFMSPFAFVQKPLRWLKAIGTYRATASGGPNFAYQQCVDRVDDLTGLDLSSWVYAFNGSEPICNSTLELFAEKFAGVGFDKNAYYPCYGLAETVVFATGSTRKAGAHALKISRAAIEQGRVEVAESVDDEKVLISCGTPGAGHTITIVDPETRQLRNGSEIGEVRVTGPSVSSGYFRDEVSNENVFERTGDNYTVNTGDLGFIKDGELYITGRLKDLIIIRGKNVYPQDIESIFSAELKEKFKTTAAAFVVEDGSDQQMVLVFEKWKKLILDEGVRVSLKQTLTEINRQLGVVVNKLCWGQTGSVPKTSSGKVRRSSCKLRYMQGDYQVIDLEEVLS